MWGSMQGVHRADIIIEDGRSTSFWSLFVRWTTSWILLSKSKIYHFDKNSLNAQSYKNQQGLFSPEFVFVQLDRSLPSLVRWISLKHPSLGFSTCLKKINKMFLACSMICSLCVWFVRFLIGVFVENLKGVGVSGDSGSIRCLYASADSTPNSFTLRLNLVRLYSMFSLLSRSIHFWHRPRTMSGALTDLD